MRHIARKHDLCKYRTILNNITDINKTLHDFIGVRHLTLFNSLSGGKTEQERVLCDVVGQEVIYNNNLFCFALGLYISLHVQ
jgi:hypothetical protein